MSTTTPPTREPLTERYVHAVTRRLPEDQRDDVALELRDLIADRVEALVAAGSSEPDAARAALVELGDPDRLAADYRGSKQVLLGPELYPAWRRVLLRVLWVVVPLVTAIVTVVDTLDGASFGDLIGGAVTTVLGLAVQICFWVTVVFAVLDRALPPGEAAEAAGCGWEPEKLPEVRSSRGSLPDVAASLVWYALLAGALVWQQLRPPVDGHPVLDPALWSFWLPLVLVALAAEAAYEVVRLRLGWTRRTAAVNTLLSALFAAPVAYLAASGQLLDPDAVAAIQRDWAGFDPGVAEAVVVVCCVAIWLWDSLEGWWAVSRA